MIVSKSASRKRERRVTAAVVELDSLPDAVRPRAEDHDLSPVGRVRFALFFVGRIQIRRERFELRAARIDAFVDRRDA